MSLSPIQIRAARLLAAGHTQEEVGKQVGVSRRTVSRWLATEEFKNLSFGLVNSTPPAKIQPGIESSRQTDNQADYDLGVGDLVPMAVKTLADILTDPDARKTDKLKAVSLVGEWAGLTSDFNIALASLRRYGFVLAQSEDGAWILHDQREKPTFHE